MTLGVQPVLGRVFTPQEQEGRQLLAVISDRLWLNRFHRDPRVLGSSIELDRRNYTIIGVMPRDFDFPIDTGSLHPMQLWVPLSLTAEDLSDRNAGNWGYHVVARLKPGVSLRQAEEDAERLSPPRDAELSRQHVGDSHPRRYPAVARLLHRRRAPRTAHACFSLFWRCC